MTSTTFASLDADISVGDVKISSDIDLDDYAFDIHTSVGEKMKVLPIPPKGTATRK